MPINLGENGLDRLLDQVGRRFAKRQSVGLVVDQEADVVVQKGLLDLLIGRL